MVWSSTVMTASRVCAVCCVQLHLSTTLRGMLFFSDVKDQATAVCPKRRNANSFFWVRRRNLRSWAEACLQNSSCFCSQRHWFTPMFSFSQFIILQIILHCIYYSFLLVVSCLEYGRRVKRSSSYSRVYTVSLPIAVFFSDPRSVWFTSLINR